MEQGDGTVAAADRGWARVRAGALGPAVLLYNGLLAVLLGRRPAYLPKDDFPFVATLEAHWTDVRAELDELLATGPEVPPFIVVEPAQDKTWKALGRTLGKVYRPVDSSRIDLTRWRTFMFRMYGLDIEPNRALCPRTAKLLDEVPGLVAAMYSVLEPGMRLPAHVGLFMGALRCHLPLRIPPGDTALRVGGQTRGWTEGEAFVFEHSRWHTAWNNTDEPRAVLILDFERPFRWRWLARLNHRVIVALRSARKHRATVERIGALSADAAA